MAIIYTTRYELRNNNVNTDNPNESTVLGERIRLYREGCGISQAGLAAQIGVRQATISRIESGHRRNISAFHLFKIAQAIGARMEEFFLFERNEDEQP